MKTFTIEESAFSHFFLADTRSALLWLVVRVYLGWLWFEAGWEKIHNAAWVGDSAGAALTGFINGALSKTTGAHPDVQGWYASFLQNTVLPNAALWSHMVAWGEVLVGVALILGLFVGISAFFGVFMNLNFMLAGTVSVNPIMYTLGIGLIIAWRVAGYYGLDRYAFKILHRSIRPRNL